MKKFFLIGVAWLALTAMAQAKDWTVDYAHSRLNFTGTQGSDIFTGGFKKFTAQIALDPDHPETGRIDVTVDMASATAGSSDRDDMLPQKEWFDTSAFPQAHFVTTAIRKLSSGHYEADATLTIKGMTQKLVLPFTLTREGDHMRAQGQVNLMRNDFSIGSGSYDNESYVKHAVTVTIDIVAR